ncbi:alkaline phosphatase family protein [Candidatus Aerophobetes bacterium]|nr:alkaline phosphatase family protein [Candidatus Aerophobetes bacterium]
MKIRPKRTVLIGLDGVSSEFALRMVKEGKLPNLKRLIDEGTLAPYCLSSLPTSTPENWTTIATGAWNGTHQVMSFQVFQPENLKGRWVAGYTSKESQAEFIWDAAERAGKKCILIKYPASWPPTIKRGIQVCGCHVRPCVHQLDNSHLFSTESYPKSIPVTLKPAEGWKNIPSSHLVPLSGCLTFPKGEKVTSPEKATLSTPLCLSTEEKKFYLLIYAASGQGYDRVIISRSRDAARKVAELRPGEWSNWLKEDFLTEDGKKRGTFRFKLEELSPDAKKLKIYSTQVMNSEEFTFPSSLSQELTEKVGPFITDMGWEGLGHAGRSYDWISEKTFLELSDYQNNWLAECAIYLTKNKEWDLCFLQSHCVDCANHYCIDKADPLVNEDEKEAKYYLEFLENLHQSQDKMIGKIMENMDENTLIIVISDHGGIASVSDVSIDLLELLEKEGLLTTVEDPTTHSKKLDLSRSKVYPAGTVFINVNLKGRDRYGIVEKEDYESIREKVIQVLQRYIEPKTGENPFSLVLRREDARMLGLYGEKIGDVLFAFKAKFGGVHGTQLSTAKWGIGSMGSLLVMSGPGIRRGYELKRNVWLVDIVPTICYLLDIPVPKDTEGSIIYQALEEV